MTEIPMCKEGNKLAPVCQMAEDELAAIPSGRDLLVTVKTPRNVNQFKLAWSLATKVAEACDWLHDKEDAMTWIKVKSRHVKILQDPRTGQIIISPKSISFASLGQDAFNRIFNRMCFVVCTEIVPGLDEETLRAELLAMVGAEPERKRKGGGRRERGKDVDKNSMPNMRWSRPAI